MDDGGGRRGAEVGPVDVVSLSEWLRACDLLALAAVAREARTERDSFGGRLRTGPAVP